MFRRFYENYIKFSVNFRKHKFVESRWRNCDGRNIKAIHLRTKRLRLKSKILYEFDKTFQFR